MGSIDIHYTKEERNGSIHFLLPRAKQKDKKGSLSLSRNSRFTTKTRRFSVCNIFRLEHGLLPYRVISVQPRAMYDSTAVGVNMNIFLYQWDSSTVVIPSWGRCLRLWMDSNSFVCTWTIVSAWLVEHGKITLKSSSRCSCDWKRRSESKCAKVVLQTITARISRLLDYPRWYPAITKESASDQRFDGTKNTSRATSIYQHG